MVASEVKTAASRFLK